MKRYIAKFVSGESGKRVFYEKEFTQYPGGDINKSVRSYIKIQNMGEKASDKIHLVSIKPITP